MSPFSHYLHDLRRRYGIRQHELAESMGYEQSYFSALEIGTKGPPTDEFVGKLIKALELGAEEQLELRLAVKESQRRYVLPGALPTDVYRMCSELMDRLECLHPAQVRMIRDLLRINDTVATPAAIYPRRLVRVRKEVAEMK